MLRGIESGPRMSRMSCPSSSPTVTTAMPKGSVISSLVPPREVTSTVKLGISSSPSSKAVRVSTAVLVTRPSATVAGFTTAPSTSKGARSSESGHWTVASGACSTATVRWRRPPTVVVVVSTATRREGGAGSCWAAAGVEPMTAAGSAINAPRQATRAALANRSQDDIEAPDLAQIHIPVAQIRVSAETLLPAPRLAHTHVLPLSFIIAAAPAP